MSSEEIFEKIKNIIIEQLQVSEATVTEEASFIDDLGFLERNKKINLLKTKIIDLVDKFALI